MAQNSDRLEEPSMDELLASIREIIEENAGIPPEAGKFRNGDNAARAMRGDGGRGEAGQAEAGAPARGRGYDATMPNLKQDIRLRGGQTGGVQNSGVSGGGAPMQANNGAPYANAPYKDGRGNDNFVHGGQNSRQDGRGLYEGGANGLAAQAGNNMEGRAVPDRGESRLMQDSMNALAERIGLRRNAANIPPPPPQNPANLGQNANIAHNEGQGRYYPQEDNGQARPPFVAAQAGNAGHNNSAPHNPVPQAPAGNVYPQNSGAAARTGQTEAYAGRAHMNAADSLNREARESARVRAEQSAYREQERPRNPEMKEEAAAQRRPQVQAMQAQTAQKAPAERFPEERPSQPVRPAEKRAESGDFDKNFADVERGTESLLRPLIAQWLDEHFRSLFEKILREEVQRFIHSMRRDR